MADDIKSATALTKDAKAAVQLAFENLGGVPRLVQWANSSPVTLGMFYTQIWGKIIPKDIKAEVDGNITLEIVRFGENAALATPITVKAIPVETTRELDS